MNKRERLERTIAGEPTDRVPVALWRHFPGDDQRASDFVRSTVEYQQTYDWDFVNVTPANSFCVSDYGVQDSWDGSPDGTRTFGRRAVERSLEWTTLRPLDPMRGALGRQNDAMSAICEALGDDMPIVQTIFSPLVQASFLAGQDALTVDMRTQQDRVHSGLNLIAETTMRFIDAMKRLPIAGIYYVVHHASYAVLSEDEYAAFGLPYDQKILGTLPPKWWMNIVHLHGELPMFKFAPHLPCQVIHWHDRTTEPSLAMGKTLFGGAVSGGLDVWEHVHQGTPASIRQAARDAITQTNSRRLILSAGCVNLLTSPLSNVRAVRSSVEES